MDPRSSLHNFILNEEEDRTWLVTYADLMTLLLVFFVLLFSLSFFETQRYKAGMEELRAAYENKSEIDDQLNPVESHFIRLDEFTGIRSGEREVVDSVNLFSRQMESPDIVHTDVKNGKITIRVSGEALFDSGSAALNSRAEQIFDHLIAIFNEYPQYRINIKGHTDNQPIATKQFPSNWELSAIRATTVLKYMIEKGISPQRLTATGYGDAVPRVPNDSDTNRAVNRRVEFVLEKKERLW